MTSVQSAVVKLAGTPVPVDGASWEHGVSLRAGDVVGSSGSVDWADGAVIPASQVAHPLRPGWSRTNGASCTVDAVKDGVPTRVFTGQVESSGGALTAGSSSSLTDWAKRLETRAHVPPVAFTMPGRPGITEDEVAVRRVGLWGTWITHLVMARAGFNSCQSVQDSAIWYQSMAGSAWTHPNPDHVIDTLGHLTTVHRLGDPTLAPQVYQGTNMPCMEQAYALGSTIPRRRSTNTAWQLTVDMASDAPTVGHTGRVDIRTLPQSAGAGVRLDWTQTQMRVYRRSTAGTLALLATAPRAVGGVYTMRWSLVVRQDGTLSLHGSGGRLNAATTTNHGIQLPSGPDPATVIVESEGPCSAVQVTRSDATSIVTQNTAARIYRSTFANRSLPGFDYVPPTPAIDLLTEQADAERGLLGMPLWIWIDHNGHLVNADPDWLAAQPVTHHFSTTSSGTPLDDVRWTRPPAGPYSRVDVRGRRGVAKVRTRPTILLYEGRQTNHDNGDALDEFLHPEPDQTWLDIDFFPYFAGQPLPAPGNQDLNRGIGSHVGGMVVTATDGDRVGWVTPAQITGWSIDSSNHVIGALEVLDHRTVLYKGTVNVGAGYAMSSMPDQGSAGLWQHRAVQPLPQLRGRGSIHWVEQVESVVATGNATHPVLEHDTGMWCATGTWRGQIGEALAAASVNPVSELSLSVGFDPTVRVGERVTAHVAYPDGALLEVEGLVAGVAGSAPADRDQMSVRLVLLESSWTEAPALGGGTTESDYEIVAPNLPRVPPPGTDPPNLPTVEDT